MQTRDDDKCGFLAELRKNYYMKYTSKTRARAFLDELSKNPTYDFEIKSVYDKLALKFKQQDYKCISFSKENWRYEIQEWLNQKNDSPEKVLEKTVVKRRQKVGKQWVNQVPVASGVFSSGDGKRAIDLVQCLDEGKYEFAELKVAQDTPVYAAFEILLYGILYVFYRKHAIKQDDSNPTKQILKANSITLIAAAPLKYFARFDHLNKFQNVLSDQLSNWTKKELPDVDMGFRFESFDFEDPKNGDEITNQKNVERFLLKKPLF